MLDKRCIAHAYPLSTSPLRAYNSVEEQCEKDLFNPSNLHVLRELRAPQPLLARFWFLSHLIRLESQVTTGWHGSHISGERRADR